MPLQTHCLGNRGGRHPYIGGSIPVLPSDHGDHPAANPEAKSKVLVTDVDDEHTTRLTKVGKGPEVCIWSHLLEDRADLGWEMTGNAYGEPSRSGPTGSS